MVRCDLWLHMFHCTAGHSDSGDSGDDGGIADNSVSHADASDNYVRLSAAAARLKSLALEMSNSLSDGELCRLMADVGATSNILLNTMSHRH